jgi:hypothetical protein
MAILHDCSKEIRLWSGLARPWPGDVSFLPSRVGPRLEPARKIRIFSEGSETRHGVLKWQSCTIARRKFDFGAVWLGRGPVTSRSCRAASGRGSSQLGPWLPYLWQTARPRLPDDRRPRDVSSLSEMSECLSVRVSEVPWCRVSGCRVSRARYLWGFFIRRCLPRPDVPKFFRKGSPLPDVSGGQPPKEP